MAIYGALTTCLLGSPYPHPESGLDWTGLDWTIRGAGCAASPLLAAASQGDPQMECLLSACGQQHVFLFRILSFFQYSLPPMPLGLGQGVVLQ